MIMALNQILLLTYVYSSDSGAEISMKAKIDNLYYLMKHMISLYS